MRTATVIRSSSTCSGGCQVRRSWVVYYARWSIKHYTCPAQVRTTERKSVASRAADVVGAHCLLSTADQIIASPFEPSFVQNVYSNTSARRASRTVVCCDDKQRMRTFCWHVTGNYSCSYAVKLLTVYDTRKNSCLIPVRLVKTVIYAIASFVCVYQGQHFCLCEAFEAQIQ